MQKKISVVIPTYDRPALLQACLEALSQQTFASEAFEVIVVSDGPDQATAAVVAEWQSIAAFELRLLPLSYRKGPAAARNLGWQQASGTLIAFTHDDCLPVPRWLTSLWNAYQNEPEIAYSGKVLVPVSEIPTEDERSIAGMETVTFIAANCACTRIALAKTGGFDERFATAWQEDSDLEFKLLEKRIPIKNLPQALVLQPARQAPWGESLKEQRKSMFNALLYKKFPELYRKKIRSAPVWHYYLILLCFMGILLGLLTASAGLTGVSLVGWLGCTGWFAWKRLSGTSRSFRHVTETLVTSALIPFLSVYWTLYGAWRYRVLFF